MQTYICNFSKFAVPLLALFAGAVMAQTTDSTLPSATSTSVASPVDQVLSTNISSGEQRARSQTFRNTMHCVELALAIGTLRNRQQICRAEAEVSGNEKACQVELKGADARVEVLTAHQSAAQCPQDADAAEHDFSYAVVQAARAGDTDAQMCYFEHARPIGSAASADRYRREAQVYMHRAMERGDWRMVQLLTVPEESIAHGGFGPMGDLSIIGSEFTIYRAERLLELGGVGDYKVLQRAGAKLAAEHLTPEQIKNADLWAIQEFNRHFFNSPKLSASPVPCLNPQSQAL